jgi:hypothetical protein
VDSSSLWLLDLPGIYDNVEPGALLTASPPGVLAEAWASAGAERFQSASAVDEEAYVR